MKLDVAKLASAEVDSLSGVVNDHFGSAGMEAVRRLMSNLPGIHSALPAQFFPDGITVVSLLAGETVPPIFGEQVSTLYGYSADGRRTATVLITANGLHLSHLEFTSWSNLQGIGYSFQHPKREDWIVAEQRIPVFNPTLDASSVYAIPAFSELEDALNHYATSLVMDCRCHELQRGWLDPERRWWVQRPEVHVRRSLEQFLMSNLRDAVVEVEHVVDEVKESDIFVTWSLHNQAALIECKWMGVSFSEPDGNGHRRMTYFNKKSAKDGLKQLASYLDKQKPRAAGRSVRGHLVVIDGRRRNIGHPDNPAGPTTDDLLSYQHKLVDWPKKAKSRHDMGRPYRMFCRPLLSLGDDEDLAEPN